MSAVAPRKRTRRACYAGVRMSADEFLALPEGGPWYELIDGVVVMSPSPTPRHQDVAGEVSYQLRHFLRDRPDLGKALFEVDVPLGKGPSGGDLVYRPDIIFYTADRLRGRSERLHGAPNLVVEVLSARSRRQDTRTKREDYERVGVEEYWIIDPKRAAMTFLRLSGGRFAEVAPDGDRFASTAVPGFVLDLAAVRALFKPW